MQDHPEARALDWRGGRTPVSRRFDDPYFSVEDGLDETRHVFLAGNALPDRFARGKGAFRVAELGFGTGLNALATLAAWDAAGRPCALDYTSFEAFPLQPADMRRALEAFPALEPGMLFEARAGQIAGVTLRVIEGDARETLPRWSGIADAWFLDGFAPAKNPELWGPALLAEVARKLVPGGTLASYTAAGHVRRALQAAGLEVARVPGYGRKRHMTIARKPDHQAPADQTPDH